MLRASRLAQHSSPDLANLSSMVAEVSNLAPPCSTTSCFCSQPEEETKMERRQIADKTISRCPRSRGHRPKVERLARAQGRPMQQGRRLSSDSHNHSSRCANSRGRPLARLLKLLTTYRITTLKCSLARKTSCKLSKKDPNSSS